MRDLHESLKSLRLHILVKTGKAARCLALARHHLRRVAQPVRCGVGEEACLPKPIKAVGEYDVELNLHAEIEAELKVFVESKNPVEVVEEEISAAAPE